MQGDFDRAADAASVERSRPPRNQYRAPGGDTISVLDLVYVVVRWRWLVLWTTTLLWIAVTALLVVGPRLPVSSKANLFPDVYKAQAQILMVAPKAADQAQVRLSGSLGSITSALGLNLVESSDADLAIALLKGKTTRDTLRTEFRSRIRRSLKNPIEGKFDKTSNLLTISYSDTDPTVARDVTARLVELLKQRFDALGTSEAKDRIKLLESRLADVRGDMLDAQNELAEFEKQNGIVNLSAQVSRYIADVQTQTNDLYQLELNYEEVKRQYSPTDPVIVSLKEKIDRQKLFLAELKNGFSTFSNERIPQSQIPQLTSTWNNMRRFVDIQEAIYSMLMQQVETLRLEIAGSSASFRVIEQPDSPQAPATSSRKIALLVGVLASVAVALVVAFLVENVSRLGEDPADAEKLERIRRLLRRRA